MGEQKGSLKDRIRYWKLVRRRRKEKKQKDLQINNSVKKYNKFQIFTRVILGLFVGIFENLANKSTKNYLDVNPKSKTSVKLFFKVSTEKLDEIENSTKQTKEDIKKEKSVENVLKYKPKILNQQEEVNKIKVKKKLIEEVSKEENKEELKKQDIKIEKVEKEFKVVDEVIEDKTDEINLKLQKDLNDKITFDNNNYKYNELKSKIENTDDLYLLCSCEYELLNFIEKVSKNSSEENNVLINNNIDLKRQLQVKIEQKKKEEVGLIKKEKKILSKPKKKINNDLMIDIENAKNVISKDIEMKENQIKSLQNSITLVQMKLSHKSHINIIKRISSTILNTTLGFFSFNRFRSKTIGKIVGSVFICNGLREMRNIVNLNQSRQSYVEFKNIEKSLYSISDSIIKNQELIDDSLEQINSLKTELYQNYFDLKDDAEFKALFNSLDKIESSLLENSKRVTKAKNEVQKTKRLIYKR